MVKKWRWFGLLLATYALGVSADYSDHPELKLTELSEQLQAYGYTESELVDIFSAAEK